MKLPELLRDRELVKLAVLQALLLLLEHWLTDALKLALTVALMLWLPEAL